MNEAHCDVSQSASDSYDSYSFNQDGNAIRFTDIVNVFESNKRNSENWKV